MNPIVVIASDKRIEITSKNIQSLLAQYIVPNIILVVSETSEFDYYKDKFLTINILQYPNNPLGSKWQCGVNLACTYNANPLIITGSDDILGEGFIERACKLIIDGNHFVGLQRWWIHSKGTAYLCDYLPHQPLGGGRIYSLQMLEHLGGKIFDTSMDKHLDDLGWLKVRTSGLKVKWVRNVENEGLLIHAIKGDWKVMNHFNPTHKNIKILRSEPSKRILPELYRG